MYHGRESIVAGAYCIHSQETENDRCLYIVQFPLSVQVLSLEKGDTNS